VTSPVTITAKYTPTIRDYTVNWYNRAGLLLKTVTTTYGSELVYEDSTHGIPTRTDGENYLTYNIFKGWDKSTGFVRNDMDVYAIWDTKSLPTPGNIDLKDMTVAQIYGISKQKQTGANYFQPKDYIDITMGTDYNFSNVESQVIADELYLDGTQVIDTGLKLFSEDSGNFTLVVDFEYNTSSTNSTLVSCYDTTSLDGFRLRTYGNGSSPNIEWGNTGPNGNGTQVGYGTNRGIVCIRHVKGDYNTSLHVYAFGVE